MIHERLSTSKEMGMEISVPAWWVSGGGLAVLWRPLARGLQRLHIPALAQLLLIPHTCMPVRQWPSCSLKPACAPLPWSSGGSYLDAVLEEDKSVDAVAVLHALLDEGGEHLRHHHLLQQWAHQLVHAAQERLSNTKDQATQPTQMPLWETFFQLQREAHP